MYRAVKLVRQDNVNVVRLPLCFAFPRNRNSKNNENSAVILFPLSPKSSLVFTVDLLSSRVGYEENYHSSRSTPQLILLLHWGGQDSHPGRKVTLRSISVML